MAIQVKSDRPVVYRLVGEHSFTGQQLKVVVAIGYMEGQAFIQTGERDHLFSQDDTMAIIMTPSSEPPIVAIMKAALQKLVENKVIFGALEVV